MKRTLKCLFVIGLLIFSFASCSNDKSEVKQSENQNHLEISVYAKNTYLENVAKEYMKKHEGTTIDIITYAPDIDSSIVSSDELHKFATNDKIPENYVKSINTSLMAKKGSDIIELDVLPYYKYAKSGYLLNLNDYLSKDKKVQDELYPKMLDAMKYKDALYAIPTDYTAYLYAGYNNIKGENIDELIKNSEEFVKSSSSNTYISKDVNTLFNILYEKNYPKFINLQENKADFDNDDFVKILELCKKYSHNRMFPTTQNKDNENNIYTLSYDTIWTQDLLMTHFGMEDNYTNRKVAKNINNEGYFTSRHSFGINYNSKNRDLAWDFIKFMVSSEMQSTPAVFPINKVALENGFKKDITQILKEAQLKDSEKVADEYIKRIKSYSEEISSYHFKDVIVEDIVSTEVQSFFDGKSTADETAKKIQQRVSLYFKE